MTKPVRVVAWSLAVYRLCIWLYPQPYRQRFGQELVQVFGDCCRDAYRQGGILGVAGLWLSIFLDLLATIIQEYRNGGVQMPISLLKRISAHTLILGGVLFALAGYAQLQPDSHFRYYGLYGAAMSLWMPSLLLLAAGVLGVYYHLRLWLEQGGRIATIVLVISQCSLAAFFTLMMVFELPETVWFLTMFNLLLMLVCLFIFGVACLRAGLRIGTYPMAIALLLFTLIATTIGRDDAWGPLYLEFAFQAVAGLVWVLFGWRVLPLVRNAIQVET